MQRTYRTVQNLATGLTTVACNLCEARALAGTLFIHKITCAEYNGLPQARRRRITERTRTITYRVAAEIDDNGNVILP